MYASIKIAVIVDIKPATGSDTEGEPGVGCSRADGKDRIEDRNNVRDEE